MSGVEMQRQHDQAPSGAVWPRVRRWAFAAVPAIGLLELAAHVSQTCSHVDEGDWRAARDYVASAAKAEDLVAFAPRWVDPVGREFFGPEIANLVREARADESRFPRAFEVSVRGSHLDALSGWRRGEERRFGGVRVTTWENPAPRPVLVDLVSRVAPQSLHVSAVQPNGANVEADCAYVRTGVASGNLGYGPAVPSDHFACPGGGFVAVSVLADLAYHPRRCIYAPPAAGGTTRRLRFPGVRLGHALVGHHAIYVEAERDETGAPVTIAFHLGDGSGVVNAETLGQAVHRDGDGWKPFEFDTSSLAGTEAELVVDITSPSNGSDRRFYCFEATVR